MKEIFKIGASYFGKLIVLNIMSFFLVMSMSVLTTAAFTKDIGYKAIGTSSDSSESVVLYEHYYEDGEDTKRQEYVDNGYTVSESTIRSEMSTLGNNVFMISTQLICWVMLIVFLYPSLWDRGTKDSNLVHFKHKQADIFKGLKAGFVAIIPCTLVYLFVLFTKSGVLASMPTVFLRFFNPMNYTFNVLICSDAATIGELSVLSIILLLLLNLVVPLICFGAYYLGYKNISISEKLVYKKDKTK